MISRLSPVTFQSLEEVVDAAKQFDTDHGPPDSNEQNQQATQQGSSNTCQIEFSGNPNATMAICHYLTLEGNFGDELGPIVVKRMLQLAAPSCSSSPSSIEVLNLAIIKDAQKRDQGASLGNRYTCLFPLGSVFHKVKNHDHIWGIGINPTRQKKFPYPKRFYNHAVRGEKTLSLIRENMPDMESLPVPYGDPGFLIPLLFPEYWKASEPVRRKSASEKSDRYVCFIPHSHDLPRAYLELADLTGKKALSENALSSDKRILLLSVRQSWRNVLNAISIQCSHVASSSLHGLVEADAMGIPSLWFQWEGSETSEKEGVFKYLDYYSSIPATRRFERPTLTELSQITQLSSYPPPMKQDEIWEAAQISLKSFPYELFQVSGDAALADDESQIEDVAVVTEYDIPELDLNYHFSWFALVFLIMSRSIWRKWRQRPSRWQR